MKYKKSPAIWGFVSLVKINEIINGIMRKTYKALNERDTP